MMRRAIAIVFVLVLPSLLLAQQQNRPRIGYIYPAGGRQGTTFEVTVGGQYLDGVSAVHLVDEGVKAEIVEYIKPVTQGQAGLLRDQLRELMDRKVAFRRAQSSTSKPSTMPTTRPTWTEDDEKKILEITRKLATFQRRSTSQAIGELVQLRITVAPDAPLGMHELRLNTQNGMTNPLWFELSQIPEVIESEPRNSAAPIEVPVKLPVIANGQIMPGDVDRYRFVAKKGQHLVAKAAARQLIPYIADAVPGWFQATLALRDSTGEEIAFSDHYRFSPDPVLHYDIQKDGEYVIEIRDSIYRGREDFVYRLSIGELPFVTGVFPLGGPAGKVTPVEISGWNLPVTTASLDTKGLPRGVCELPLPGVAGQSILYEVSDIPELQEREPNDEIKTAQAVTFPVIVNGRIAASGDVDVLKFEGAAGEKFVAEVMARRLNSPLDSLLVLMDSSGKQIAANDDREDKGSGLNTHHADSYISTKLPATGTYYVLLRDTQQKGGSEYAYRLRMSQPRPDFALRVTPSSVNLRGNTATPLTVYALRHDGFAGEIQLFLKGGEYKLSGGQIPAGQDEVKLTMTAQRSATTKPVELQLEGRARIDGREVNHEAVPADDWMQAFAYHHLVPAAQFVTVMSGRFAPRVPLQITSPTPLKLAMGKASPVRFSTPPALSLAEMDFKLADAPEGISIQKVTGGQGAAEMTLQCDSAKFKPGQKGNLIINCYVIRKNPQNPNAQPWLMGSLPAIPFEVTR